MKLYEKLMNDELKDTIRHIKWKWKHFAETGDCICCIDCCDCPFRGKGKGKHECHELTVEQMINILNKEE